jgi:hypothetical protein
MNYEIMQNTQVSRSSSVSNFDYMIYVTIGIIYAVFISLLVDRSLNYDKVENTCDQIYNKSYRNNLDTSDDPKSECNKVTEDFHSRKYLAMIVVGVLSVFGGAYLGASNPMYATGGYGVALGGLYSIIFYTMYNWQNIDKDMKVVVLGLTLAGLFYGSIKLF